MNQTIKLKSLSYNPDNPRDISPSRLKKLMNSISEFSHMLYLRPIVVDSNNVVLGGNQRLTALKLLSGMEIPKELLKSKKNLTQSEAKQLSFLQLLRAGEIPAACVINAEDLTEDEKRKFIVLDNASFGDWNLEALEMQFTRQELDAWGVDALNWDISQEPEPETKTKAKTKQESSILICPHCGEEITV